MAFTIPALGADLQYPSYDVTLMDLQMTEMDGFGALEAIRAQQPGRRRQLKPRRSRRSWV